MSATNGIYVLQGVNPTQIASAPVGAKVVDIYDDSGNLFSPSQVSTMESGGGAVLGYFSIGEAENYRSYFSALPSSVLGPQDPSWPGDYEVAFWTPQWLSVAENYIQTMLNNGYQGAFFDVVDEAFTTWAQQNAPNHDPQGAMLTLIQELSAFARAQNPNFQIWINSSGAEQMLTNSSLLKTINGVYEEQLFYQNATTATRAADLNYNVSLLDNVTKAGKSVVAVEYVSSPSAVSSVESQAAADGFGYYIANPNLNLNGVDTQGLSSSFNPGPGAAPTVTISSAGGVVSSATQTIAGTVDVADAGSTVTVLDGTKQISSALVSITGSWSAQVTLNSGSNSISATDTNSAGVGTSNSIIINVVTSVPTPPTVAIASTGGIVTQANQTIVGTVDVGDAGSTVAILDGNTQIGSAVVDTSGNWSTSVTLLNQGANALTAFDSNAAGTGTSNSVTFDLQTSTPGSTAPALTIADTTLSVAGNGGTVDLGISVSAGADASQVGVTIRGLKNYEVITDGLGDTFTGKRITLTESQIDSGLALTSLYKGNRNPVNTLTVVATDVVDGVTSKSASQTITITDPPAPLAQGGDQLALLRQYMANSLSDGSAGPLQTYSNGADNEYRSSFLSAPHH